MSKGMYGNVWQYGNLGKNAKTARGKIRNGGGGLLPERGG